MTTTPGQAIPAEAIEAAIDAADTAIQAFYADEYGHLPTVNDFAAAAVKAAAPILVQAGRREVLDGLSEEWCAWADGFQAPWAYDCGDRETAERFADQCRRVLDLAPTDVVHIKRRYVGAWEPVDGGGAS